MIACGTANHAFVRDSRFTDMAAKASMPIGSIENVIALSYQR